MIFIVGILAGVLLTVAFFQVFRIIKKNSKEEIKYGRRGIYIKELKVGGDDCEFQFEVGEVESTNDKSKIVILNTIFTKSILDTPGVWEKLNSMMNNSCVYSSSIECIEENKAVARNNKIDDLLR